MTRYSEHWFRIGTALFALAVVLIVAGIGVELYRQSILAIEKFGLRFWLTDIWDPVAGDFGVCRVFSQRGDKELAPEHKFVRGSLILAC